MNLQCVKSHNLISVDFTFGKEHLAQKTLNEAGKQQIEKATLTISHLECSFEISSQVP